MIRKTKSSYQLAASHGTAYPLREVRAPALLPFFRIDESDLELHFVVDLAFRQISFTYLRRYHGMDPLSPQEERLSASRCLPDTVVADLWRTRFRPDSQAREAGEQIYRVALAAQALLDSVPDRVAVPRRIVEQITELLTTGIADAL